MFITIDIKYLTVQFIRECLAKHTAFQIYNPGGELFQHEQSQNSDKDCLLVDVQSANVVVKIHDALKPENRSKFNRLLRDEFRLANFFDKMWEMVA